MITIDQIKPNEGAIVEEQGKKIAVYKDNSGNIIKMSPVCTHLSCIIGWNETEKTWDCPCHGSRFDASGHVINGPAKKNLEPKN